MTDGRTVYDTTCAHWLIPPIFDFLHWGPFRPRSAWLIPPVSLELSCLGLILGQLCRQALPPSFLPFKAMAKPVPTDDKSYAAHVEEAVDVDHGSIHKAPQADAVMGTVKLTQGAVVFIPTPTADPRGRLRYFISLPFTPPLSIPLRGALLDAPGSEPTPALLTTQPQIH